MTRKGDVNTLLLCTCTLHHVPPSKRPAAHAAHATATIVHVHELVAVAALFTLNLSVVGCGRLVSGTAGEQQQSPHMQLPGPVAGGGSYPRAMVAAVPHAKVGYTRCVVVPATATPAATRRTRPYGDKTRPCAGRYVPSPPLTRGPATAHHHPRTAPHQSYHALERCAAQRASQVAAGHRQWTGHPHVPTARRHCASRAGRTVPSSHRQTASSTATLRSLRRRTSRWGPVGWVSAATPAVAPSSHAGDSGSPARRGNPVTRRKRRCLGGSHHRSLWNSPSPSCDTSRLDAREARWAARGRLGCHAVGLGRRYPRPAEHAGARTQSRRASVRGRRTCHWRPGACLQGRGAGGGGCGTDSTTISHTGTMGATQHVHVGAQQPGLAAGSDESTYPRGPEAVLGALLGSDPLGSRPSVVCLVRRGPAEPDNGGNSLRAVGFPRTTRAMPSDDTTTGWGTGSRRCGTSGST